MKNKDGASNFFKNSFGDFQTRAQGAFRDAKVGAYGEEAVGLMDDKKSEQSSFDKFNTASQANTNPFGNLAAVRADQSKQNINQLTGEIDQSKSDYRQQQMQQNESTSEPVPQAIPQSKNGLFGGDPLFDPNTNGTGSGRPNFAQQIRDNMTNIASGAPMNDVLFKKK